MTLQSHSSDADPGNSMTVGKDSLIDQPPMSIWHWGTQAVTRSGCMWLEVVYAQGTIANGGPIEEPTVIR